MASSGLGRCRGFFLLVPQKGESSGLFTAQVLEEHGAHSSSSPLEAWHAWLPESTASKSRAGGCDPELSPHCCPLPGTTGPDFILFFHGSFPHAAPSEAAFPCAGQPATSSSAAPDVNPADISAPRRSCPPVITSVGNARHGDLSPCALGGFVRGIYGLVSLGLLQARLSPRP